MRFLCENMELVAFDKDIGDMFLSPWEDSDAKITVEGITFHVHSIVVSMTSVFLKRKLADSTTKEITLNDVEWTSMAYVLRMMYPQYELNLWTLELKTLNQMLRVCENLEIKHLMKRIENHISHLVDLIFHGIGVIHFPQILSIVDKYEFQESILKCTLFTSRTYPFYTGELKKICEELEITAETKNKIMINIAKRHLKETQKEMGFVEEPQKTLFCVGRSPQDYVKMTSFRQKWKEDNLTSRRKTDDARNSTLFDLKPVDGITKLSYDLNVSSNSTKPGDASRLKSSTSKETDSPSNILKAEPKVAGPINDTKHDNLSGFNFFGKPKSEPDKNKTETNKQSGKFAAPTNDTKSDFLSGFSFGKPKSETIQRKAETMKLFGKLAAPTNDTKSDNSSGFSLYIPKSEPDQRKTVSTQPSTKFNASTNDTKSIDNFGGFTFNIPKSESEERKTEITKPTVKFAVTTNYTNSRSFREFRFNIPKSEPDEKEPGTVSQSNNFAISTNEEKKRTLTMKRFKDLYCILDCISKESLTVRFLEEKLEKININNDTKSLYNFGGFTFNIGLNKNKSERRRRSARSRRRNRR